MVAVLIAFMLAVASQSLAEYKIQKCVDPYRPEAVAYFGDALKGGSIRIVPYCVTDGQMGHTSWYLLCDGAGDYLEHVIFSFDGETRDYVRTVTPCPTCYDYERLAGFTAAWIAVEESLFDAAAAAKYATIALDQGEKSPRRVKFPPKARDSLTAFREAVRSRLSEQDVATTSAPANVSCDSAASVVTDTLAARPVLTWLPDSSLRWLKMDTSGSLYAIGEFMFRGPKSSDWTMTRDTATQLIVFNAKHDELAENLTGKKLGFSRIHVFPYEVERSQWGMSEDQIADDFRDSQEASIMEEGVFGHSYELGTVIKGTSCVRGVKSYYFLYDVVLPTVVRTNVNLLHLCFPPDFASTHTAICFLYSGVAGRSMAGFGDFAIGRASDWEVMEGFMDYYKVLATLRFSGQASK